jgi:hypothetical protein
MKERNSVGKEKSNAELLLATFFFSCSSPPFFSRLSRSCIRSCPRLFPKLFMYPQTPRQKVKKTRMIEKKKVCRRRNGVPNKEERCGYKHKGSFVIVEMVFVFCVVEWL